MSKMKRSWLMKQAKYDYSNSGETLIEHAIKTFQIGKYLYEQTKPEFDRQEFLYGCFFHDVGKLVSRLGEPHTPRTREGLNSITKTKEYGTLIESFGFGDLSQNERVIRAIEKHHDSENELSAYISIADQIASSENDENLKNRLRKSPISTLITYLNEMHGFHKKHFYYLRFHSFSKNELNVVGRLFLLKLLYETIEQLSDVEILYETLDGCRIVTNLDSASLKPVLSARFNKNLVSFFENQNLEGILGGAPDNYAQFTNLPREIRPRLVELTVKKYANDIITSLKKKNIRSLEDIGLDFDILSNFVKLDEVSKLASKGIRGISKTKYFLFADENGTFPRWVAETFLSNRKDKITERIVDRSIPRLEQFLSKAGADISKITCKEEVYNKLFPLVVAINSLEESTINFHFDLGDYLAIDDEVPLEKIARKNPCANCGAFEGEVELTPFAFEYKQHAKESLFEETEKEFRDREKVVCGLCQIEAIFNTLLCGTKLEGMQARVNTHTHFIICGLGIAEDLFENLAPEEPIKRLLERCNITSQSAYVKKRDDFQFLVLRIANVGVESGNVIFQRLLFSWLASRLKNRCLILAFGVNKVPTTIDNSIVQFNNGKTPIINDISTDFFEYVLIKTNLPLKKQRGLILQYVEKPFIGMAQIFKKGGLEYNDDAEQLVEKLSEDDEFFKIADQIWDMVKVGGVLETRKNVGSFLGGFNGTPTSIDIVANRLLKNSSLTEERRSQMIEIYEKLRITLGKMDAKQRKQLKDYIQKTKYLFNSKKLYEMRLEGGRKRGE